MNHHGELAVQMLHHREEQSFERMRKGLPIEKSGDNHGSLKIHINAIFAHHTISMSGVTCPVAGQSGQNDEEIKLHVLQMFYLCTR